MSVVSKFQKYDIEIDLSLNCRISFVFMTVINVEDKKQTRDNWRIFSCLSRIGCLHEDMK